MASILLEWRGTKRYSISEDGVVLDTIKGRNKTCAKMHWEYIK